VSAGVTVALAVLVPAAELDADSPRERQALRSGADGPPAGPFQSAFVQEISATTRPPRAEMMKPMATTDGRMALVTGAASGIGAATTIGLARVAVSVVLLVRNAGRGEQAMRDIRASMPDAKLEVLVCDLAVTVLDP
jgi:hypothetical protein